MTEQVTNVIDLPETPKSSKKKLILKVAGATIGAVVLAGAVDYLLHRNEVNETVTDVQPAA